MSLCDVSCSSGGCGVVLTCIAVIFAHMEPVQVVLRVHPKVVVGGVVLVALVVCHVHTQLVRALLGQQVQVIITCTWKQIGHIMILCS